MGFFGLYAQPESVRADSLKRAGNYEEALKIFNRQLEANIKSGNKKELGKNYNNVANVYSDKGDYEKSTEYYFKALKLAEKEGDLHMQAVINFNVASNYFNAGKADHSKEYLNKAIEKAKVNKGDGEILGLCYNMLGGLANEEKKYAEALEYLKNAEIVFTELNKQEWLGNVYVQLAYLFSDMKDHKKAIEYSRKGISIFKAQNEPAGVAICYQNLHRAHFYQWNPSGKVTNRKETLNAIALADSAYKALKGIESPEVLLNLHKSMQEYYAGLSEYDSAYVYFTKYVMLNDSIHGVEKNKQLEALKLQYDFERQERQKELLQAKSEKRTLLAIIAFASAGLLLLILGIFGLRNRYKKRQKQTEFEKNLLEYEQQALRAQMNPHFIFNAINSIQKFILKKDKQEAYDYLSKFAKLIRMVLNNSQEKDLSLGQELDMIKLYVELEQLRFNNSFEFKVSVEENLSEQTITVPAMLIQPYVENAIWHGIMNLDSNKHGVLILTVTVENSVLKIVIEDNGVGRESSKKFKEADAHKPVGMVLTEKRLQMINKLHEYKHAKVTVTDLYDENKKPSGTKVEITMPVNEK